ncbi:ABC transporter substrate-binding protein [Neobacillus cucumis]|uniref:ABC transporter substrate-binding protein n=1 Tax=Neobacillus cucumis TaxID=1740721 RepID=UPI001963D372|nr:ABC transporter substrate-binding protein [Neobacillus cucumis]MBM7652355.1 peptide/nickel transport system substrate-binding protein [Neobacillus cucumis]
MKPRHWKKVIPSLLTLILLLSGCASSTSTKNSSSQETNGKVESQPKSGGELTYALATSPDSLDPARSGLAVAVRAFRTIFDSLVVQVPDNTIKPWLATEWTVSDDGKTYTFKLRKDVKFQDGTPFNAEAVKYSYDRILDPKTQAKNAVALLKPYQSSEVIDDYTIKINLATPSTAFLSNLSQAMLGIVSPTAAEKYGDQFGKHPVGTGPYKFVSWTDNADIVVEKNKDYQWGPSIVENQNAPYLDKITFKIIPEEATRIGSVQRDQVLAAETVPPQNILSLKNDPKTQLLQVNTIGLPYTLFFNQRRAPWNNVKARKAVQLAVDVDAIVKTLYLNTYSRAWSPLSPGILGYDKSLENSTKVDIEKANQLLEELGYVKGSDGIREKDGKKLTLKYVDGTPNREKRNDIAVMVQQQLKKIGIKVEINITKDIASVILQNADYDIYGNSQVNSDPNALRAFYHSTTPQEEAAVKRLGGGSDQEIDQLLEAGTVETDQAKRKEIYKQVQQKIIDQAWIIPIYVFPYTVAASKTVNGIKFDALGYPLFNDVNIK